MQITVLLLAALSQAPPSGIVVVGGEGRNCGEDPGCINRLHPAIPMAARAAPGQTILLRMRNALDINLDPAANAEEPWAEDPGLGAVHALAGPVHIEGARPGDVLAVTILDIDPGSFGLTLVSPIGFVSDRISTPLSVLWHLDRTQAVTDAIPGVRIPNASFPGVVTVLPGPEQLREMLARGPHYEGPVRLQIGRATCRERVSTIM
jgi:formamidase